jgi:hypothetical protein
VIALWLGHESPETTLQYIEADWKLKEALLDKAKGLTSRPSRFQPKGKLLDFLDSLSADYAEASSLDSSTTGGDLGEGSA